MKPTLLMVALAAMTWAADVTGTWTGPLELTRNGETKPDSAHIVLKQSGEQISGSVGPSADKQNPITKGTITGNELLLETNLPDRDVQIRVSLKVQGDKLVGTLNATSPDGPVSGTMTLRRAQ